MPGPTERRWAGAWVVVGAEAAGAGVVDGVVGGIADAGADSPWGVSGVNWSYIGSFLPGSLRQVRASGARAVEPIVEPNSESLVRESPGLRFLIRDFACAWSGRARIAGGARP